MATIKSVLLESVRGIGKAGEIVQIPAGYFRNYLLKAKKAVYATDSMLKDLEHKRLVLEQEDKIQQEKAEALSLKMEGFSISIQKEAGENDILYGSVSSGDLERLLQSSGMDIKKSQIRLLAPLKKLGTFQVMVDLHSHVTASFQVVVERA